MPEDNIRPIRPALAPLLHPTDEKIVTDIILRIAGCESIETIEQTLDWAMDYVQLVRMQRDRARFGDE